MTGSYIMLAIVLWTIAGGFVDGLLVASGKITREQSERMRFYQILYWPLVLHWHVKEVSDEQSKN